MTPPARPYGFYERAAQWFLWTFGPRLKRVDSPAPPAALAPYEPVAIPRAGRGDHLSGTWYPAPGAARGAVLLLHPWIQWGQAYFHRRGRIHALRKAGYSALTFDFGGFGGSGPPAGLADRDIEDALAALRALAPGLPLHLWGVSFGGNWSHAMLSRRNGVGGAVFEHPPGHLIEFSYRMAPRGWPAYATFRRLLPRAYGYLELRRHAPHLQARQVAYVGGELDAAAPAGEVRELAGLAGARCLVVPGAGHLSAIKAAPEAVFNLALGTFETGER